jgi:hypothetical protein
MTNLGLTLLPTLRDGDIYAENTDLETLELEANLNLQNLDLVFQHTAFDNEQVAFRVKNILGAVERAKHINGGVYIG